MSKFFVSFPSQVAILLFSLLFSSQWGHIRAQLKQCNSPLAQVAVVGGANDCTQYTYVVRAMRAKNQCSCSASLLALSVPSKAETAVGLHHKFVGKRQLWFPITAYQYCYKGSAGTWFIRESSENTSFDVLAIHVRGVDCNGADHLLGTHSFNEPETGVPICSDFCNSYTVDYGRSKNGVKPLPK